MEKESLTQFKTSIDVCEVFVMSQKFMRVSLCHKYDMTSLLMVVYEYKPKTNKEPKMKDL